MGKKKGAEDKNASKNGFAAMGLSDPVYRGIVRMGFRMPTPVQRKALPVVLTGADTVVMARTGSGKTCAFLIPLLEKLLVGGNERARSGSNNSARALILSPTRELSLQTLRVLTQLAKFMDPPLKIAGIHGSESMEAQFEALAKHPDVIVATPGRLAHHLTEVPDFKLDDCEICILDEADRLLELGFAMQLRQIARKLPSRDAATLGGHIGNTHCQKMLLSATMPQQLVEFTKTGFCCDPHVVRLDAEASVSAELRMSFITCRSLDKDAALLHLISLLRKEGALSSSKDEDQKPGTRTGLILIFCATRHHVEYIYSLLLAARGGDIEDDSEARLPMPTLSYGTLDAEARKSNLAAFRSGRKPIMVVTDVAARGMDVPLIDHVIHYHFPPSPKLFVHRSGRAARAGRLGYSWALAAPDELPYMVDLHVFLGLKLQNAVDGMEPGTSDADDNATPQKRGLTYTLQEMTPEMVHYGSVPELLMAEEVENVRRIRTSELTGSGHAETMRALAKVCDNAMKQYRRTRPEASKSGVHRSKALLEGERQASGQRMLAEGGSDTKSGFGGSNAIPVHPLLRHYEICRYESMQERSSTSKLHTLDNLQKRDDMLRAMANFRPKETVFEAFATGGGKEMGVLGQVDKGRTSAATGGNKKNTTSFALTAMKNMRRQMRIARDKGTTLVVAGSANALEINDDIIADDENDQVDIQAEPTSSAPKSKATIPVKSTPTAQLESKRRMSRAERKRLKKNPNATTQIIKAATPSEKASKSRDFRDHAYFIDDHIAANPEEAHRQRQVEAALQPSASTVKGSVGSALRMEEAMLDIVGDENDEMVQKQRMMRWDKSKRKYVQTTIGSELSGESRSKKLRLESGKIVKSDKMKLGELYEKWQKKTNKSIGRSGVFDEAELAGGDDVEVSEANDIKKLLGRGRGRNSGTGKKKQNATEAAEKPRTARDIKADRDVKQDMKVKNMKKGDRRRYESQQRKKTSNVKGAEKKGYQGKKGASGRWKK